jgi:hypothetical protein
VRAFYLDLAQWAVEDPARWGPWVAPCPVGAEEINRRKFKRQRKARMDARTRERLPVLPVPVSTVDQRRKAAAALLAAAHQTPPGQAFTAAGQTLARATTHRSAATKVWADDPATGARRDLGREEDHAFWAWAAVEVLRATGIRLEELTELSHHSLVSYRLPTTGELVPLLQILPSKTDAERLLLVSPELAEVLSAIIRRVRDPAARCRWSLPTTLVSAPGRRRRRCCSSARSATSATRSPPAASATCSPLRWPTPACSTRQPAARCTSPRTTSAGFFALSCCVALAIFGVFTRGFVGCAGSCGVRIVRAHDPDLLRRHGLGVLGCHVPAADPRAHARAGR